ncbi:MAG: LemA family protein [Salibacteraceae bacterium]
MKNILIGVGVIAVLGFIGFSWFTGKYDTMVALQEEVTKSWADVESQYQRRSDLIPNLVNTVKGYADHEKETLTGVVEARAKATSVNIDPSNMTTADLQNFNAAQGGLGSALSKLMVVVEKYPDLKANQNFMQLQAQLEGTENRISVARTRYNESARMYNTYTKGFVNSIIANNSGFDEKPYFEAKEGTDVAPEVAF